MERARAPHRSRRRTVAVQRRGERRRLRQLALCVQRADQRAHVELARLEARAPLDRTRKRVCVQAMLALSEILSKRTEQTKRKNKSNEIQ